MNSTGFGTFPYNQSIQVADVNGDGKLDVVVSCLVDNAISVLLGNGDGTFAPQIETQLGTFAQYRVTGLAVADFDGDGVLDVATLDTYASTVDILTGNGDGSFAVGPTFPVTDATHGLVSGDFNQDGLIDYAVNAEDDNQLNVFLNTSTCPSPSGQ